MKPGEHKSVQSRILVYAQAIGWAIVTRAEAEERRGGILAPYGSKHGGWKTPAPLSLFFDDLLDAKVRAFNPRYAEAEGALLGQFRHLHTDIYGNREFVGHLRNRGKFFDHAEKRERDLILIDYDDPARNVYEVTEEWAFHNGHFGTREDVVFFVNGIPVLVIECKNADKDEAIALGVDQIRRYHRETPELFVSQQLFTATDAIGFSYGVSWNTVRRNIFNWKHAEVGKLEAKVKSFCAIPQVLAFLKDYIVFAEKDEELNKILERAVNLKNFLKGKERIRQVAEFVARHYRENVEPLGYKAFLVGVDREACAHYKHALDQFLPPEYSAVVYTGNNNDSALLKEFHLDPKKERQIRKSFGKLDQQPKILIVTEKLLAGFDAPVLYAMYLDKPMRDHTLLQAIARVNRPYKNEAQEMVKPHGFVLDFVGIFDKLEKALAFDSDEINAIVKDLALLKVVFQSKMEQAAKGFDGLTYFVYRTLLDEGIGNAEEVSRQIKAAFVEFPNWQKSEGALRELRKKVTFALVAESEDIDGVAAIVDVGDWEHCEELLRAHASRQ